MKQETIISEIENNWMRNEVNFSMCNPDNVMSAEDLTIEKQFILRNDHLYCLVFSKNMGKDWPICFYLKVIETNIIESDRRISYPIKEMRKMAFMRKEQDKQMNVYAVYGEITFNNKTLNYRYDENTNELIFLL